MVEAQDWLYYLINEDGKSYYVEADGQVLLSTQPKPLKLTPDGWQDISIAFERGNDFAFGNVRNFSLPLSFVVQGARILRELFYKKNFDEKVYLLVQKQKLSLTPTEYSYWFDYFYKGEIDLSTFNAEELKVTVNIMEGGISKDIKANINTRYEFNVDELFVRMDGLTLQQKANFFFVPEVELSNDIYGANIILPVALLNTDGNSTGISFTSQNPEEAPAAFADKIKIKNGMIYADIANTAPINVTITGTAIFKNTVHSLGTWGFRARFIKEDLTIPTQNDYQIFSQNVMVLNTTYTLPVNIVIPMNPGETAKLEGIFFGGSGPVAIEFQEESTLEGEFHNRFRETNILVLKPLTLLQRLIERINGDAANVVSSLLEEKAHLTVTCGDAIRGFGSQDSKIKTSLADFIQSYGSVLCAAWGIIGGKFYFERRSFFMDEADPIALGEVKEITEQLATDMLINTIKIGYPDQTYDDVNGRQEFNTTNIFTSPVKRISKELNLISTYRADAFGIEYTRINLDGKTTTDSDSDNDVFIINVDLTSENDDGSYNLKRVVYDSTEGLLFPDSVFNIEDLTPKRMLNTWKPWLNGVFYGFSGQILEFSTTDKNRELSTTIGLETVDEDASVTIENSPRLFKPVTFEFTPQSPTDLVEQLEDNPNRCFSFIHTDGELYTGFNLKIGIACNSEEEQRFLLLSTNSNDLTQLAYA